MINILVALGLNVNMWRIQVLIEDLQFADLFYYVVIETLLQVLNKLTDLLHSLIYCIPEHSSDLII